MSFNGWILSKILAYLSSKEGMSTSVANYTADGVTTVVQDSFGYRYEIKIKSLNRIYQGPGDLDEMVSKIDFSSLPKVK